MSRLWRLVVLAVIVTAVWILVGLFFATQHNMIAGTRGEQGEPGDPDYRIASTVAAMWIWAALTPVVFFVAERLPLRKPHLLRNLLVLLLFAVAIAALRSPIDPWLSYGLGLAPPPAYPKADTLYVMHLHVLFALVLIGVAEFMRMQREAAERRRAEARAHAALAQVRLRRLRADLHPHFLFNALNAVAALVHTDPAAAERTLDTLSELLRKSIATEDAAEVPLCDELEFIERYLDVQKTRFGDRLRTRVSVAGPELLGCAIPPLLIQPLVENAIVHGFRRRPDGGSVEVRAQRDGRWLLVEVRDDGAGTDPETVLGRAGVGVTNARARLEYLYGSNQALTFRRDGTLFVAAVRLPLRAMEMRIAS